MGGHYDAPPGGCVRLLRPSELLSHTADVFPDEHRPVRSTATAALLGCGTVLPGAGADHTFPLAPLPVHDADSPEEPTVLDGTYLRVVTLERVGGVPLGLPIKCQRCPPYLPTPGLNTLILYRGEYYLHHQMSDFHSVGHFLVSGDRIALFNDVHCPDDRAVYRWSRERGVLTFELIEDSCTYGVVRAKDLGLMPWVRVNPCTYKITNLWPAEVAC
jgi:hypothetical protein